MDGAVLGSAVVTCLLAVVSVSLWTARVTLTSAGRRLAGAGIACVEALTFSIAFSRIVSELDNPVGLAAYAVGVGAGTLLGVAADDRFSPGQSWVRVIVDGNGSTLTQELLRCGWPVTVLDGQGPFGPVAELLIGVDDSDLRGLLREIDRLSPAAFRTVERLRSAHGRVLPGGLRQMGRRGPRKSAAMPSLTSRA